MSDMRDVAGRHEGDTATPDVLAARQSEEPAASGGPSVEPAGQSGFSPFGTIGTVGTVGTVIQQAAQPPQSPPGDGSLTAMAVLVGVGCIASMIGKLIE